MRRLKNYKIGWSGVRSTLTVYTMVKSVMNILVFVKMTTQNLSRKDEVNYKMLIPAIAKKEELEMLFAMHMYDDEMFLYNAYPYYNSIPNLQPEEQVYKWAITNNKNEVVGYFTYHIDTHLDTVNWFGLYSFKKDATIGIDVYKKMKDLIKHHRRVEWRMVGGNPVEKHYDRFIERYGGRKVVLMEAVKDQNGIYHDDCIYEIVMATNFKECEIVYEDQYMTTNPKVQKDNAKNFLCSNAEMILYLANGKLFICDSYSKLEMATDIAVQKYPLTWAWAIDSTGLLAYGWLCEGFQTELAMNISDNKHIQIEQITMVKSDDK